MSKQTIIDFDQSLYRSKSAFGGNTMIVNCYPTVDNSGRSKYVLNPIPGSTIVKTVTGLTLTGCRGMYRSTTGSSEDGYVGTIYAVFGNTLIRYTPRGTYVVVGTFNSGNVSGLCTFAENQAQTDSDTYIYVCDRQSIYKFNAKATDDQVASTFAELGNLPHKPDSSTEYATPSYISWDNYRLIMSSQTSNAWFYTELGTDIFKETNVYFGESRNDKTIRVTEFGGNIWSFGTYSNEVWSRTGRRTGPYSTSPSNASKVGIASPDSLSIIDTYMFWLGSGDTSGNAVYLAQGNGKIDRISDDSIEQVLKSWKYSDTSIGQCFSDKGNVIYILTSKFDNMSIGYNLATNKWFQLSSSDNGKVGYWDVSNIIKGYNNEIYFGPLTSNNICKFDFNSALDYNNKIITRLWQSPIYIDNLLYFKLKKLTVDLETGTSNSYSDEPQMFIQLSWDGGKTWLDRSLKKLGKRGQYKTKVELFGGGMGRNLVIRLGTSAIEPINFYQLKLETEGTIR